ncbi:MAG TPA: flagellar biosynthetic protein FliQ [Candidatus Dormibacteraeota bacterium]|nr:flagellar biosynthetic protein FliQ [Candidatus Dormibacteraeota bacterium]
MDAFGELLRSCALLVATMVLPVLGIAALVGTAVAIVQAATQIQEQTLVLLPKVLAVGAAILLLGGLDMHLCAALFMRALDSIGELTR